MNPMPAISIRDRISKIDDFGIAIFGYLNMGEADVADILERQRNREWAAIEEHVTETLLGIELACMADEGIYE